MAFPLLLFPSLCLDGSDVLCLPALRTLGHVELDALALLKGAKTVRLNRGVMDEYVLAVVAAKKTETLGVVEPLDCALFHDGAPRVDLPPNAMWKCLRVER